MYDYETDSAVEVVNSATEFPVGCKFIMEVLGCDVCDQTTLVHAYVIFNNFKLSPDFDWSIATDGAHPFSGKAQQAYCDKEKRHGTMISSPKKEYKGKCNNKNYKNCDCITKFIPVTS